MYHFKFVDIGEGLYEGKILSLNIKENAKIKAGDVMFVVETDKVTTEITAPIDGMVTKINFKPGDIIKVGDIVVDINEKQDQQVISNASAATVVGTIESSSKLLPKFNDNISEKNSNKNRILISPLARKKAAEYNININNILGSGPNNRILIGDIDKVLGTRNNLFPSANIEYENLTMIRKTIVKNMLSSKQNIVEASLFRKIDITSLVALRKQLKPVFAQQNLSLSYLPFIIKALSYCLIEFKKINCFYDQKNERVIYKNMCNIGIAIDTEKGLVVPIIKNANVKSITEITGDLNCLVAKAKQNDLTINDMKDGSFTITNYGSLGIEYGTPIIKYPEVAIIGIGVISQHMIVIKENSFEVRHILPISMTIDHRIIDGADAGRFLQKLNHFLTNPHLLI